MRGRPDGFSVYTSFAPWTMGIDRPFPECAALAAEYGFDAVQVE